MRNKSPYRKPQTSDFGGFKTLRLRRALPLIVILLSAFTLLQYMRQETANRTPQLRAHDRQPGIPIKIMTFNLRFASVEDGPRNWTYRKNHVIDIINRYHPTIMGTQEGLKDQLADIDVRYLHAFIASYAFSILTTLIYDI